MQGQLAVAGLDTDRKLQVREWFGMIANSSIADIAGQPMFNGTYLGEYKIYGFFLTHGKSVRFWFTA